MWTSPHTMKDCCCKLWSGYATGKEELFWWAVFHWGGKPAGVSKKVIKGLFHLFGKNEVWTYLHGWWAISAHANSVSGICNPRTSSPSFCGALGTDQNHSNWSDPTLWLLWPIVVVLVRLGSSAESGGKGARVSNPPTDTPATWALTAHHPQVLREPGGRSVGC